MKTVSCLAIPVNILQCPSRARLGPQDARQLPGASLSNLGNRRLEIKKTLPFGQGFLL
jgi:hypothetical protein